MNRKKTSKANRKISAREKEIVAQVKAKKNKIHPFDDVNNWLLDDFKTPPWSEQKIQAFQKRLDSAFEAPNGIVLAWSGDRRYGDVFLNEKGEIERKPPLLFAEHKVNDRDYIYISCPRWLLMEVLHGSQLEASWEEASMVNDPVRGKVRIRPEQPPEFAYHHFKIIAEHDQTMLLGETPRCCERMLAQHRICYGKYREPSDEDIALVGATRQNMNNAGVTQRNDEARTKKVLMDGTVATRHFIKRAREQQAQKIKDLMLANAETFFGNIPKLIGTTKTHKELEHIYAQALEQQDEERFA